MIIWITNLSKLDNYFLLYEQNTHPGYRKQLDSKSSNVSNLLKLDWDFTDIYIKTKHNREIHHCKSTQYSIRWLKRDMANIFDPGWTVSIEKLVKTCICAFSSIKKHNYHQIWKKQNINQYLLIKQSHWMYRFSSMIIFE
jgi:hypothetical protein